MVIRRASSQKKADRAIRLAGAASTRGQAHQRTVGHISEIRLSGDTGKARQYLAGREVTERQQTAACGAPNGASTKRAHAFTGACLSTAKWRRGEKRCSDSLRVSASGMVRSRQARRVENNLCWVTSMVRFAHLYAG
jgi:hypothetical protein